MAGWERSLVPTLARLIDAYPNYPTDTKSIPKRNPGLIFPKDRKDVRDLSPNHWEMGISADLLWCTMYGDQTQWAEAREKYLYLLSLHLDRVGLWTSEQYTGVPHGSFYLVSMFAARMAMHVYIRKALMRGGFEPVSDKLNKLDLQLKSELDQYTMRTFDYMILSSTRTGEVVMCGERMPKGPSAIQQSAVLREVKDLGHVDVNKIRKQINTDFWLSLRAVRKLIDDDDPILDIVSRREVEDIPSLPFTAQRVKLERWGSGRGSLSGHRAWYTSLGGDSTCRWVWTDGREVQWGTNEKDMPPVPRNAPWVRVWETSKKG